MCVEFISEESFGKYSKMDFLIKGELGRSKYNFVAGSNPDSGLPTLILIWLDLIFFSARTGSSLILIFFPDP